MSNKPAIETRLARLIQPLCQLHPELSGVYPLEKGNDAFAARYLLANMTEKTLDVQYYIWHNDISGRLLFNALFRAAERGVKVRLLLDDNNTGGLDESLRRLNAHPNISVKLFNPFKLRRMRCLCYLTDFKRLNRRMHNKSMTFDGQATIVGGRNVGDEYFGIGDQALFSDLDVLAVGKVVEEVCQDFERYWHSACVSPAEDVLGKASDYRYLHGLTIAEVGGRARAKEYLKRLRDKLLARQMENNQLSLTWAKVQLFSDDPRKGLGELATKALMASRLFEMIGVPKISMDIISAYFVPTRTGVSQLVHLSKQGVKITVLTNSLAANDVAIVHAGYAKWRKMLLRCGIELFEMKANESEDFTRNDRLRDRGLTGHSGSSLHAKTFAVDGKLVFVGSFNFDPRSARLNTEMGFVIQSESLTTLTHQRFIASLHDKAFQLMLTRRRKIHWIEYENGKEFIHRKEPDSPLYKRILARIAYYLPIEWML